MAANITLSLANFPAGYCWAGPQQYATDLVALITASLAGDFGGVIISATLPAAEDQDKIWFRLDGSGYLEGVYKYQGVWCRPHPIAASSNERRLWVGTADAAGLWAYDGGDGSDPASGGGPTATTGAMWQVDTNFNFRIPMGVGTGTEYDSVTRTLAVGENIGSEKVQIAMANIAHKHAVGRMRTNSGDSGDDGVFLTGDTTTTSGAGKSVHGENGTIARDLSDVTGDFLVTAGAETTATAATYHENLPPVRGIYIIKRTSRTMITVTA